MNNEYKSPYTKEELEKMYPAFDGKRLAIGAVLAGIVMWLTSMIIF